MLVIILLAIGIILRLTIHIPNFTPVTAIALFGGVYLNRRFAVLLPLLLMMISDSLIGLHDTILFTWGSFVAISFLGLWLRNHKNKANIIGCSLLSAVFFFFITNLGVWLVGSLYPRTLMGLSHCFILAIPFFQNTLLSSLFYSIFLFASYEISASWVKQTRFARALLTV